MINNLLDFLLLSGWVVYAAVALIIFLRIIGFIFELLNKD